MSLTAPWNLLLTVLLVGGFIAVSRFIEARSKAITHEYTSLPFLDQVLGQSKIWDRVLRILPIVGVALLGFALAGPHVTLRLPITEGTVVVCVDTSGSMESSDVLPTRAQAAIAAVHKFISELGPSVQVGVISFSSSAQVVTRPILDRAVLSDAVETIPKPNGATAIGDALELALQIMPTQGRRAVVLLTDGVNNRGTDPIEASHDLANHHIPLYTIGIGTANAAQIIPGSDESATTDPEALKQFSQITGGTSVVAADADSIVAAFQTLARSSIWEVQRLDASVVSALLGGACVVATLLLGVAVGKVP